MSSLETELQECHGHLHSDKVSERKKGITELRNLLDRDAAIHTLNKISITDVDSFYSWNSFFTASHNAMIKEVDKYQGKSDSKNCSSRENNKRLFASTVTIIAKCGTKDGVFIKCGSIVDAVIYILESSHYRREIGSTYLNILYENVLSVPKYWGAIKLKNWRKLFELCLEIFENHENSMPHSKNSTVIAIMSMIVKHGCEHSSLLIVIKKKIFLFLKKVIRMTLKESVDFQFQSLKLVLITCEKLKKECRMMVCKFTEEICDRLLDIGRTLTHDEKKILYDILLLTVECHHPNGVTQNSGIDAYAHDWDDWNRKLKQLNYAIKSELDNNKQKYRKLQVLPSNFLKLAVEVHNQIFCSGSDYIDVTVNNTVNESILIGERSSGSKRRRIMCRFSDVIDRLKETESIDMWPWLSVISSLISRYPKIVNDCDYILLLQNMCNFLSVSKERTVTDYLCSCCVALIDVRRINHFAINPQDEDALWDSILNTVLRTIGLNQNVEWSHKLLQHMMKFKWKPNMRNSVLKLYISQVVRLSTPSLTTLCHLRLRLAFPLTFLDIPVCSTLLRWLLPVIPEYSCGGYFLMDLPLEDYAHVIVLACLKNNVKCAPLSSVPQEFNFSPSLITSAAEIHSLTSYCSDIFHSESFEEFETVKESESKRCVINDDAFEKLLNFLEDHQQSLFELEICKTSMDAIKYEQQLNVTDALTTARYFNSLILFLIRIQNFVEFYASEADTTRLRMFLEEVLKNSLIINRHLFSLELNIDKRTNLFINTSTFFQHLGPLPPRLIEKILQNFFPLLEPAVDCMENEIVSENSKDHKESSDTESDESLFEVENLSKRDRLKLEACRLLVNFSFNRNYISGTQYRVLEKVLEILLDVFSTTGRCSRVFLIMGTFTVQKVFSLEILRYSDEDVEVDLFPDAVKVIKGICSAADNSWYTIAESAVVLMKLVQQAIEASHRRSDTSEWEELVNLIRTMVTVIPDCGPQISLEIARCLSLFKVKSTAHLNDMSDSAIGVLMSAHCDLLTYLKNPFHEVRVTIVRWLASIFTFVDWIASKSSTSVYANEIVDNFSSTLFDVFVVEDLVEDELVDENVNRPLTVFYALGNAICNSKTTRRRQIFMLFYITHEKRLNSELAFKILRLVGEHMKRNVSDLIKDNMVFVLSSWYTKYKSFDNFPFQAVGRDSVKEFYSEYIKELMVVLLYFADIEKLNILSNTLETTLKNLLKDCFPEIMSVLLKKRAEARKSKENTKTAATVQEFVFNTMTNEGVESMTVEKLADLLTCILRHLHDADFEISTPSILPLPTALASDARLVHETIKCLQEMMGTNNELIIYVAEYYPKFVQKIFQKLFFDVMKSSTAEIKLESLQKYFFFCKLLMPHHAILSEFHLNAFISRTVVKNVLCFLSTNEADSDLATAKSTLKFFLKFVTQWLSDNERYTATASVFSECLKDIVGKLVIVMSRNNELDEDSMKILRYLLSDRQDVLSASIANLEQFPDRAAFSEFRIASLEMLETQTDETSLRNDIELFLKASENSAYSPCRVESLKYLHKQLSDYKFELIDLFKNGVPQESFPENDDKNIAHNLICTLIQQTRCEDEKVNYEAVRCLTEIGLVNLHTVVLKHNYDSNVKADCAPELFLAEKVCTTLKDCVVDEDVDLVNAACRVLYSTLFSREGFEVISSRMSSLEKSLIYPFVPMKPESVDKTSIWLYLSVDKFKEQVDTELLWSPDDPSYAAWIQNLVTAICSSFHKKSFLNAIQTVCKLKVPIAETIFKCVINLLATSHVRTLAEILGGRMNQFLNGYFNSNIAETLPDSLSSNVSCGKDINNTIYNEKSCVQILLEAANLVRLSRAPDTNDLNLNYLYIAKAALHCHAYFTCILYAELYINSLIKNHENIPYDGNILSYLEKIETETLENQNEVLNTLRQAFSRIGDLHALYGCGSSLLLDSEARIQHYQQIESWQRVIESCDINLAVNRTQTSRINDLTIALGNSGFNHLQSLSASSFEQLGPQLKNSQYQCAWKLGQWDLEEPCDHEKTFSYYQYAALKDIHLGNFEGARVNVELAENNLVREISRVGLESTKNVYYVLGKLQCLQDIESFTRATSIETLLEDWRARDGRSVGLNFDHRQMIFSQRVYMLDTNVDEARDFVLNVAKQARRERNFNFADVCLSLIKDKVQPSNLNGLRVRFEEARVLRDRGETHVVNYLMKDMLKHEKTKESPSFRAILSRTYAKWLSETKLENADTIFEHYNEAIKSMPETAGETVQERKIRLKTYKQLAEFADSQYQQIAEYIKSDVFEEQIKTVRESRKNAVGLQPDQDRDLLKSKITLANQSRMEESEVREMQKREKRYLMLAFKYYLKVLAECSDEDLKVFRVISFWLRQKMNPDLHKELKEAILSQIPSYKFLCVLPQLMAHVTRNTAECFGSLLNKLLARCARDHPHHTLPLIFSLVNYNIEDKYYKANKTSSNNKNEDRVIAACDLIRQLRPEESIRNVIGEMEELNEAYIELAYYEVNTRSMVAVNKIPKHLRILKIKNFENTFCPTFTIPISKTGCYDNIVGVRHIENQFSFLGGINAPKKIKCVCTDGHTREQMIKGKDDMRMDAVMQQVFTIMNKLLSENKHTSKRKLLLRTYKVVPLSQRSGVLEFCTNTTSLGEYLAYASDTRVGAHKRFRPQDITTKEARKKLQDHKKSSEEKRIDAFKEVCTMIKPVFRYFFVEHFPSSSVWFERKLAYIHSVATTSMVGYILGLGDRHVQNILIDQKTAELIHIDFGIAFDQGLNLNYPERIPFRLTRDVEDGMGIFSIEGIFRRCCEQVMDVLRENSEIICTTSEVFIHDPLYQWTLTSEKRSTVQNKGEKTAETTEKDVKMNIIASRALSRLKLKLQGMEDGTPTNVEGQVNRLIQQAKDVTNLALLFEGWQAYL